MHPTTSKNGFTLIELIVAIAVLGILITVGLPAFTELNDRHRLKGATQGVFDLMQFARSEAVKRNETISISFAGVGDSTWCAGLSNGGECDCTETDSTQNDYCDIDGARKILNGDDFSGTSLDAASFAGNTFTSINPMRGTATAGSITLDSAQGLSTQVLISTLGRVRYCSDDPALGYPSCS